MTKEELRKEAERTVEMLPEQPPRGTLETVLERDGLKNEVLVYHLEYTNDMPEWIFDTLHTPKRKQVHVTCTECGHSGYFEYYKRNSYKSYGFVNDNGEPVLDNHDTLCPFCGSEVRALRSTSFKGTKNISTNVYPVTLHNVNGHLCLLKWCYEKDVDRYGNVKYTANKNEGIIVIENTLFRVTGWYQYFYAFCRTTGWELRARYDEHIVSVKAKDFMPLDTVQIYGTDSKNCAIEELINGLKENDTFLPGCYLKMWCKYQNVENLVRGGFKNVVNDILNDCLEYNGYYYSVYYKFNLEQTKTFVDWKKKKPHEMLRIEKEEAPIISKIGLYRLPLYVLARQQKAKVDVKQLMKFDKNEAGRIYWLIKNNDLPAKRTVNYLSVKGRDAQLLSDYWNMLHFVYGEISESERFPKDLHKAHDRLILLKSEKENKKTSEQIAARANKLKWALFSAEGLTIVLPKSNADFIIEGQTLNHCVARYAKTHAEGKTTILFVRRQKKPNEPFYTLEYNGKEIVQDHGKNNKLQTPEVLAFEAKWLSYIRGGLNNGKRNNDKSEQRAGA